MQRRNPVLALIKNVGLEVGDIQADYQVGATTGVLFLRSAACNDNLDNTLLSKKRSLRYHRLHPEYLHTRIEKLQGVYLLRILLVLCDVVSFIASAYCVALTLLDRAPPVLARDH